MNIEIIKVKGHTIALLKSDSLVINELQDAVDLLGESGFYGAGKIIINEAHLTPEFFDLKTHLAGDILQKFSNYKVQLAIIGDFSKYSSKSLRDFIRESNRYRHINFAGTIEEAMERLLK